MKEAFALANLLIVADYILIGWFFLGRLRMAAATRKWKPITASAAAFLFFLGCAHTHIDQAILPALHDHWWSPLSLVSHWAQAIGGFVFWILATRYLVINIFDRETYEAATDPATEQRLHYLALRAGLVRR